MKNHILRIMTIGCVVLSGLPAGAAVLDLRESFNQNNSGWGGAYYKDAESLEYEAVWSEIDQSLWDGFDTPEWVDLFLFADSYSSNGAYIGNYVSAGVQLIVFDIAFNGVDSISDFSTYMITEDQEWFEYAWQIPDEGVWGSYLTPMEGDYWYRWDATLNDWVQESPTAADWQMVSEVGVSVRTVDVPSEWSVLLDDFFLTGNVPAPNATAGFIEEFSRGYSLWLEDRLSNTSGEIWDAIWDSFEGALVADFFDGEEDTLWLFADAFGSHAQLVGDYVAAGVESIDFEMSISNPAAVDNYSTYIITESGQQFEYTWSIPEDGSWYVYSTPLTGDGWFRWDPDESIWLEESPQPSDWEAVNEVGVVARSNGEACTIFLDNFGLGGESVQPSAPVITDIQSVGVNRVRLEWTSEADVLIEHSIAPNGSAWEIVSGPISGSNAEFDLPAGHGFFRVRYP